MKVRELLRELQAIDREAEVMVSTPRAGDSALLLPTLRVETGAFEPPLRAGRLWFLIHGTDAWGQYLPSRGLRAGKEGDLSLSEFNKKYDRGPTWSRTGDNKLDWGVNGKLSDDEIKSMVADKTPVATWRQVPVDAPVFIRWFGGNRGLYTRRADGVYYGDYMVRGAPDYKDLLWCDLLPADVDAAAPEPEPEPEPLRKSVVDVQRDREALNWQTVARAVRVVDAQHRGPGPGMDDDSVLNSVLDTVFKYAKDAAAARVATAFPDGPPIVGVVVEGSPSSSGSKS